jgi:hypothetical protein
VVVIYCVNKIINKRQGWVVITSPSMIAIEYAGVGIHMEKGLAGGIYRHQLGAH